jgi:3-hydroxybutyryl-CoA dehydrogenase
MSTIKTVGVIGAGTMGNGIAQACAATGIRAVMVDVSEAALEKGRATIAGSLERLVKKEKLTARSITLARPPSRAATLAEADRSSRPPPGIGDQVEILKKVDRSRNDAVVASNTSSSRSQLAAVAAATVRRHALLHPVPVMALVELIRGLQTSDATVALAEGFAKRLGKTPIVVKNSPGFVVNRILCPMINEAIFALQDGLASAQAIDDGMKLGCNHPIGPLALADMIGLDVMLAVMEVFYRDFADPKYRPAPLLREMVAAGWLGRKSNRPTTARRSRSERRDRNRRPPCVARRRVVLMRCERQRDLADTFDRRAHAAYGWSTARGGVGSVVAICPARSPPSRSHCAFAHDGRCVRVTLRVAADGVVHAFVVDPQQTRHAFRSTKRNPYSLPHT